MPSNSKEYSNNYYYNNLKKKDDIFCEICNKNIKYISYGKHIKTKKHNKINKTDIDDKPIEELINIKFETFKSDILNLQQENQKLLNEILKTILKN